MKLKISPDQKAIAAALKGKTIARVEMHPFDPNQNSPSTIDEPAYSPVVVFTDGTRLRFVVQETEVGEYGVEFRYPAK